MFTQLYNLIGHEITHDNNLCVLIEVIDDGPLLVFQCQTKKQIQHDQHGNANRRTLPTFTINCLNESRTDLHAVVKKLVDTNNQNDLLNLILSK